VTNKVQQYAEQLAEAENTRIGTAPLTAIDPDLTVKDAYAISASTFGWRTCSMEILPLFSTTMLSSKCP
jgi:hypothetical protein